MAEEVQISEGILTGILLSIIKSYRFTHEGRSPRAIVLPRVNKVDGVVIKYPKEK